MSTFHTPDAERPSLQVEVRPTGYMIATYKSHGAYLVVRPDGVESSSNVPKGSNVHTILANAILSMTPANAG